MQVAADIKEATFRTSDVPFLVKENANIPTVTYEVSPPRSSCAVGRKHESCVDSCALHLRYA